MLTQQEVDQARAVGAALRMRKAAADGAPGSGWGSRTWNTLKDTGNAIGSGAKGSVYAGIYGGVPVGMLWFAVDRARKLRTQKEREKEQELTYYKDYLQSVGAE